MTARLIERAPAKVNLALHVLGRRADGFHDLESLVAFSHAGDLLTLETGGALRLRVEGPSASHAGPDDDNLVLRAARGFQSLFPESRTGVFRLLKTLPAAAGLGGGSSDAAATLRLLARANDVDAEDPRIVGLAATLGSDVPVCLAARARVMRGVGERLGPRLVLPPLFAVLANPGVPLPTRPVFEGLGLAPGQSGETRSLEGFDPPVRVGYDELVQALERTTNDLQAPAVRLRDEVRHALAALRERPGAGLVRMSGSGATCFALFRDCGAAARAARSLRDDHPAWWVKSVALR